MTTNRWQAFSADERALIHQALHLMTIGTLGLPKEDRLRAVVLAYEAATGQDPRVETPKPPPPDPDLVKWGSSV